MLTPEMIQKMDAITGLKTDPKAVPVNPASLSRADQIRALGKSAPTNSSPIATAASGPSALDKYGQNLAQTPQRIWEDYKAAGQGIVSSLKGGSDRIIQGANDLSKGDVLGAAGNIARGIGQGVLGGLGNFTSATFAPIGEAAKGLIPQTGNETIDSATQGAGAGAALGGPIGAAVGAVGGLAFHGVKAAEDWLMKNPKIAQFAKDNPDVIPTFNNALNVVATALGTKSGAEDTLNTNVSEVPGKIAGNLKDTANATGIPGAVKDIGGNVAQGLKNVKEDVGGAINKVTGQGDGSDKSIIDQYNKAIRPSTRGKSTSNQIDAANQKVVIGVRRIAQNEPNLELTDANGETVSKLPESPKEFSDAITQTKAQIYKEYNARQQVAGLAGATVDLNPIASELSKIASDPVLQDVDASVAGYAKSQAKTFSDRGSYSTDQAQKAIEIYNQSLDAFYKNPDAKTASRVAIDSMIANMMRKGLDSSIENAHEGEGGQSYQDLKNEYGALKSMEKDVANRSVIAARAAPKGFFDIGNIASAAEFVKGLATLNPASLATAVGIKGMTEYLKWRNNPDTIIKSMFNGVRRASGSGPSATPTGSEIGGEKLSSDSSIANDPSSVKGSTAPKIGMTVKPVSYQAEIAGMGPEGETLNVGKTLKNLSGADLDLLHEFSNYVNAVADKSIKSDLNYEAKFRDEFSKVFNTESPNRKITDMINHVLNAADYDQTGDKPIARSTSYSKDKTTGKMKGKTKK